MQLQEAVAICPERFEYFCPALARNDGALPAPVGQPMHKIAARPLTVVPGETYEVKKALDMERAKSAFGKLSAAARRAAPETLHPEQCQGTCDDSQAERPYMATILRYGTFLSDAILVALAARPVETLRAEAVVRRLAVVDLNSGEASGSRKGIGVVEVVTTVSSGCFPEMCCATRTNNP
mmetsp:Transcript_118953/g.330473  ORF Transcript_118953/g.330473 Transcript_118953/m.330473 type:complete len:180 (-) Transcript_118953:70-609(-)